MLNLYTYSQRSVKRHSYRQTTILGLLAACFDEKPSLAAAFRGSFMLPANTFFLVKGTQ